MTLDGSRIVQIVEVFLCGTHMEYPRVFTSSMDTHEAGAKMISK